VVGGLNQILATINSPCNTSLCPSPQDSSCTFYTAANLPCSGINTQDSIEVALQKIDTLLCASSGNYASYNTYCLAPITTQQQFVQTISAYVCATQSSLTTFTGTTFPAYQATINSTLASLQVPGTTNATCSSNTILNTDTLQTVLQKLSNMASDIYCNQLSLSSVNWNQCFTVSPTPTTVAQGFSTLASQICTLQTSIGSASLPVFNNVGSCLPTPVTSADTLVSTVNKIKTLLCQTPTFNINTLTWNCITQPSNVATDLQDAFQAVLNKINIICQSLPTFSGNFSVTATNPSNPCSGVTVDLSGSVADRLVAATTNDNTPGVLSAKLVGDGTTISVNYGSTTQGIISYIGGGTGGGNGKVMSDSGDSTSDYLFPKLEVGPEVSGISISPYLDTTNAYHQVGFKANLSPIALFTALLQAIPTDTTGALQAAFCAAVNACPSPCAAPTNVSIVYGGTTSSTTTTTTTGGPTTTTTSTTTTTTTTTGGPTTTTTSTSSTTTTTTTTIVATIYVGAQTSGTPPIASVIEAGNTSSQNPANDVNADWTPFNSTPQYCWVAIPAAYVKTWWEVTSINQGAIGGGDNTFGTPTAVTLFSQSYLLYFTNFQTQFEGVCAMQASEGV